MTTFAPRRCSSVSAAARSTSCSPERIVGMWSGTGPAVCVVTISTCPLVMSGEAQSISSERLMTAIAEVGPLRRPVVLGPCRAGTDEHHVSVLAHRGEDGLVARTPEWSRHAVDGGGAVGARDHDEVHPRTSVVRRAARVAVRLGDGDRVERDRDTGGASRVILAGRSRRCREQDRETRSAAHSPVSLVKCIPSGRSHIPSTSVGHGGPA